MVIQAPFPSADEALVLVIGRWSDKELDLAVQACASVRSQTLTLHGERRDRMSLRRSGTASPSHLGEFLKPIQMLCDSWDDTLLQINSEIRMAELAFLQQREGGGLPRRGWVARSSKARQCVDGGLVLVLPGDVEGGDALFGFHRWIDLGV